MIDRINAFATQRFGIGTTAGSFVRIHVWAIVFLVAVSLVWPSHKEYFVAKGVRGNLSVRNVALDPNYPRGFAPSPFGKDRFRIVWITGSEGHFRPKNQRLFLPIVVTKQLPMIDGRPLGVDMYFLSGIRIADIYFALLDAIKTKPDMIVVTLNPAWALNPISTHQWTQLDSPAAVQLLSKPSSWPLAASLFSPSDLAWGVVDKAFRPLKDRNYNSQRIHRIVDDFGPLDRNGLREASNAQKPTKSQRLSTMDTVGFWLQYRLHEPRDTQSLTWWAQMFEKSNEGRSALNKIILRAIAKELRDSKIPSLVYDAPVNNQWLARNKALDTAVSGVERQLEELRGSFTARNILFEPRTASRFLPPLQFRDMVHLKEAGAMGPYLVRALCRLVAQTGEASSCTPSKGRFGG